MLNENSEKTTKSIKLWKIVFMSVNIFKKYYHYF